MSLGDPSPKELPSEVRPFWRRARSVLVRVRSVLEGVAAVGEPRLTGGVRCRGVLSTDLPLSPATCGISGHGWRSWRLGATGAARGRGLIPARAEAPAYTPTPWPAWPSLSACVHGTALRRRRGPVGRMRCRVAT